MKPFPVRWDEQRELSQTGVEALSSAISAERGANLDSALKPTLSDFTQRLLSTQVGKFTGHLAVPKGRMSTFSRDCPFSKSEYPVRKPLSVAQTEQHVPLSARQPVRPCRDFFSWATVG